MLQPDAVHAFPRSALLCGYCDGVGAFVTIRGARHSAATGCARFTFRACSHSSKRWTTTNSDGTNSTARQVEAIIPVNTVMPIDLRALAPAPVASTSGTTERMNAIEVIRIGRKRVLAASTAESAIE